MVNKTILNTDDMRVRVVVAVTLPLVGRVKALAHFIYGTELPHMSERYLNLCLWLRHREEVKGSSVLSDVGICFYRCYKHKKWSRTAALYFLKPFKLCQVVLFPSNTNAEVFSICSYIDLNWKISWVLNQWGHSHDLFKSVTMVKFFQNRD